MAALFFCVRITRRLFALVTVLVVGLDHLTEAAQGRRVSVAQFKNMLCKGRVDTYVRWPAA